MITTCINFQRDYFTTKVESSYLTYPHFVTVFSRNIITPPTTGHSGVRATLACMTSSFCWLDVYQVVKNMVQYCDTCQHNKYQTQKNNGLLQPLPIPNKVWDELTMDFITHFPNSFRYNVIWVICDHLTKLVYFIALPSKFFAKDLASCFAIEIFCLHGIPKTIISYNDPLILSTF